MLIFSEIYRQGSIGTWCFSPISSCSVCLLPGGSGQFGFPSWPSEMQNLLACRQGRIQQRQRGDIHQQVMMAGRGHINPGRRHAHAFQAELHGKGLADAGAILRRDEVHLGAFRRGELGIELSAGARAGSEQSRAVSPRGSSNGRMAGSCAYRVLL